ncbi:ATP-dependent DNA helicase [Cucurbitaria berberidis CBS 394.84]|uniref:ATP-dependent DNA helicase n=1 Tax=Cucurbitaria berberidis CBS 394.84 TaxID=1168544 RepID=A0A9P4L931_9PLEO|nr:ATP-dependent DNA helicase [Cucurbitaria berberidis CBS 394.84]KAF1845963.1 ATP-dependent DNA helicase [Cucurbitaria berberidis CBS 394.84]
MPPIQGCAEVLSATAHCPAPTPRNGPRISLVAQDVSSNLDTIHRLCAAPDACDGGEKRAQKRRKVENGSAVAVQQTDFDENKSIVLAKVSLDLSFPTPSQGHMDTSYTSNDSCKSISVSLESFHTAEPNAFRVVIWNTSSSTGAVIVATTQPDLLHQITPHLRTGATLATTHNGKKSRPVSRATFCRCLLIPATDGHNTYKLDVEIRWTLGMSVVEDPTVKASYMKEDLRLLMRYFRDATSQTDTTWTLSDFYDSVYVPPTDLQVSPRIQHSSAETSLYSFQQRAVDWLLRREGVAFSPSGTLEPFVESSPPASFWKTQDATGNQCHISHLRGMVVKNLDGARGDTLQSLRGGILAEEMGLGKTVELIALMSHHKRHIPESNVFDAYTGVHVKPSGATLIITPPSILQQWISELHTHAPELKVFHYKGLPSPSAPKNEHSSATVEHLTRYDVILTTYQVLSKEIHHATPAPDRSFRHGKRHERRTSPLVGISWWRVCLDEAQMVESGVSQAAKVARIIPRCNAWAVSGTPLRKDVQDLRGLLIFLRCDAFANNKAVWDRLDKASFKAIFNQLALRHTKDKVRDELRLPPQKRIVITVPFTAIEEQHYTELTRQMCDSCWLTPEGNPIEEGRDANHPDVIERMRDWLVRLRQTCLHAHVGRKNRRALGAKNGALRTVHEVLEVMIEQNDSNWKSEAREMILNQIKLGHIKAYAGNIEDRAQIALPHYEGALEEAQAYVKMCREEIQAEREKLGKNDSAHDLASAGDNSDTGGEDENEGENVGRIQIIRKSLRSFLELEHACNFFIATTYHQIKENEKFTDPESEDFHRLENLETEWYEKAKVVRRELLKESKGRAQQQMAKVNSKKPFHQVSRIDDLPGLGGIEAHKFLAMMDNISDFLNAQAEQIHIWRMKIVDILLERLLDDEDDQETTGEEYDGSLKAQDELYVYIMGLRTLIADRNAAVHGLQDTLVEHELKAAEKQARRTDDESGNRGHAPELVIEVANTRRKLQAVLEGGSLKGVVSGIRSLSTMLQWRADGGDSRAAAELDVVQKHFTRIQSIVTQHAKTISELEKEQEMFRSTMNQRLEYYRQFQRISDTVAKWKEELDETFDKRGFAEVDMLRKRKKEAVAGLKRKYTYLTHLRAENHKETKAECIICQDTIELGVLTTCGHKYCKECINTWWHAHRTCPLCKQKLSSSDFKDISFKPSEVKAQEETHESASPTQASTPGSSLSTSIYSDISDSTMKEIKMIDLDGSYGTKIDMIARHLIWIRNNDPGAKSIVFSQFGDFLEVLREALKKWKIGVSGITDKDGIQRFKTDPAVECFLLDAKSDSSGLNLVNATYVFLCEPLINPAIELQAIARVHRIGQQRPTTVFMYLVSDTVEEAIYDISVTRRLEHISSASKSKHAESRSGSTTPVLQEKTLDAANSAELQAAPLKQLLRKKGDGEIVQVDDLWKCLFGKQRKQVMPVLEMEVGRHLRAEAVDERRAAVAGGEVRF